MTLRSSQLRWSTVRLTHCYSLSTDDERYPRLAYWILERVVLHCFGAEHLLVLRIVSCSRKRRTLDRLKVLELKLSPTACHTVLGFQPNAPQKGYTRYRPMHISHYVDNDFIWRLFQGVFFFWTTSPRVVLWALLSELRKSNDSMIPSRW